MTDNMDDGMNDRYSSDKLQTFTWTNQLDLFLAVDIFTILKRVMYIFRNKDFRRLILDLGFSTVMFSYK